MTFATGQRSTRAGAVIVMRRAASPLSQTEGDTARNKSTQCHHSLQLQDALKISRHAGAQKQKRMSLCPPALPTFTSYKKRTYLFPLLCNFFYSFLRDFFLGNFFLGWHDRTSFKVSETFITPALHAGC
jgi:hypothetical protein